MGITLGETKEKAIEGFLTLVEIGTAITAIILAAIALSQSVVDNPCYYRGVQNDTDREDNPNDRCFVMTPTELICCGQDRNNVIINAGVLQLSALVFTVLVVRLLLTLWRCQEVRREEKMERGNANL